MNKIFAVIVTCILFGCGQSGSVPEQDLKDIEEMFEILVKDSPGAYTLFGSKPMSLGCYDANSPFSSEAYFLEKGWQAWIKHKRHFKSPRYELLRNERKVKARRIVKLYILDEQAVTDEITSNLDLFQKRLQMKLSATEISSAMIENSEFLAQVLDHSDLLGILLGYERVNSLEFREFAELSTDLAKRAAPPFENDIPNLSPEAFWLINRISIKEDSSLDSTKIPNLVERVNEMCEKRAGFDLPGSAGWISNFSPPMFMVTEKEGSILQLQKRYSKDRERIIKAYHNNKIAKVTLDKWTNP